MAINLWKIGGKPTSYNPLPNTQQVVIPIFNEYDVKFKAKSLTNAILNIHSWSVINDLSQDIALTTEFKNYSYSWKETQGGVFGFIDKNAKGDIIIEDIQLVQKPLPKLTINGIDGFTSGKWVLHANARIVDDETLELNATADFQNVDITVSCLPNTTYTYKAEGLSSSYYTGIFATGMTSVFANTGNHVTFTTGASGSVKFTTYNGSGQRGKFTFKRPMLNLGTTPAPYERKKGERMVLPIPKGNLIPTDENMWEQGSITGIGADSVSTTRIRMKGSMLLTKGKQYTLSVKSGYQLTVHYGSSNTTWLSPAIFTVDDDGLCRFVVKKTDDSTILPSEITQAQIMLNEGNIAQPYTPYTVQVNKKPKRYVPKKNYLNDSLTIGLFNGTSIDTTSTSYRSLKNDVLLPAGTYTFSCGKPFKIVRYRLDGTASNIINDTRTFTLTNPSLINFSFRMEPIGVWSYGETASESLLMLQEGSTATPYEPYQKVLPKPKRTTLSKRVNESIR